MPPEHAIRCRPVAGGAGRDGALAVSVDGAPREVSLRVSGLSRRLAAEVPDRASDLLEIAATAYAADAAIGRGGATEDGRLWRRRFAVTVAVREPDLWSRPEVAAALQDVLFQMSEDAFTFGFEQSDRASEPAPYFTFDAADGLMPDEVSLFSGGLDSFAGALDAVARGDRIALVTAASATKLDPARKTLVRRLRDMTAPGRVQHVPVSLQLGDGFPERTHRTRSFVYASLGVVAATLFGLDRARFYENGVVSLNLPPSAQVIGARATRSTHPQTLAALSRLFSLVFDRPIRVDNPFIWKTKTDVVRLIADLGEAAMIRQTRSCAEVYNRTVMHPHCGLCSQCVDRRFAVLAAGVESEDPVEAYKINPVHGPRPDGRDREMALGYVRNGRRCATMTPAEFFASFGEAQRALAFFDEPTDATAERLYLLHKRHGEAVRGVVDRLARSVLDERASDRPNPDSLLALVGRDVFGGSTAEVAAGPASLTGRKQATPSTAALPVVIDRRRRSVRLGTLGAIGGVGFQLIDELARTHLASAGSGHAPEDHAFTQARGLADRLDVDEETVRKRIQKVRRQIGALALAAGVDPPEPGAVIENSPWRGYRLNPSQVRVELTAPVASPAAEGR